MNWPFQDIADCGDTIGCFMNAECDGMDCTFLVTWRPHDDVIDFTISASVGAGDSKWVAVGLSDDARMVSRLVSS